MTCVAPHIIFRSSAYPRTYPSVFLRTHADNLLLQCVPTHLCHQLGRVPHAPVASIALRNSMYLRRLSFYRAAYVRSCYAPLLLPCRVRPHVLFCYTAYIRTATVPLLRILALPLCITCVRPHFHSE